MCFYNEIYSLCFVLLNTNNSLTRGYFFIYTKQLQKSQKKYTLLNPCVEIINFICWHKRFTFIYSGKKCDQKFYTSNTTILQFEFDVSTADYLLLNMPSWMHCFKVNVKQYFSG